MRKKNSIDLLVHSPPQNDNISDVIDLNRFMSHLMTYVSNKYLRISKIYL